MSRPKSKGSNAPSLPSATRPTIAIRPSTETIRVLLERDLVEWADDLELRLVWADLLQMEGDPLGRLINLDHVAARDPSARPDADALREALAHRLDPPRESDVRLHWQLGFVHLVELRPTVGQETPARASRRRHDPIELRIQHFVTLLERPALRFLDTIHVVVPDDQARAWTRLLWYASHPTLREVHFGAPPRLRERPSGLYEIGRAQVRDYDFSNASYMAKLPRLCMVTVAGEMARLPCREGSSETRVHHVRKLAQRPLTSANRAALRRGLWDASGKVQDMAHQTIRALGPAADFMLDDLALLLLPPIGDRDPRQVEVFASLSAIGPAAAAIVPSLLASDIAALTTGEKRCVALLGWLRSLGRAARPALELVESLADKPEASAGVRKAAKAARKALLAE